MFKIVLNVTFMISYFLTEDMSIIYIHLSQK